MCWASNVYFHFICNSCLKHFSPYEKLTEIRWKMCIGFNVKYQVFLSHSLIIHFNIILPSTLESSLRFPHQNPVWTYYWKYYFDGTYLAISWGCSRIGYWGKYLDLRGRSHGRKLHNSFYFSIRIHHHMFAWWKKSGWMRWDRHVACRKRRDTVTWFWCEKLKEKCHLKT
jgi:hypothetical protein